MYKTDFASYADDSTPFSGDIIDIIVLGDIINDVIYSINLFKWFLNNQMKGNSYKSHLIISKQGCMNLKLRNISNEKSTCEKIPGVQGSTKLQGR